MLFTFVLSAPKAQSPAFALHFFVCTSFESKGQGELEAELEKSRHSQEDGKLPLYLSFAFLVVWHLNSQSIIIENMLLIRDFCGTAFLFLSSFNKIKILFSRIRKNVS